ncbi:DUF2786 domain-containing protein [Vibrio harveyi]|uniref:DUF2786 domain-containing protein n=1 Tax=Vibrio harveyi TaxID=669 RepID=UPI003BB60BF0
MADNARIIDKIKKLLSLAESSNPNEAFLAAKRARHLMDQHSITKSDIESASANEFLEAQSEFVYRIRNAWLVQLQAAVGELNDCEAVIRYEDGCVHHTFRGFTADAIVAKMTLDYLIEACDRCCKNADVSGRSARNQFRLGFSDSITKKMEVIMEERRKHFTSVTGTEIIPLKLDQIRKHFGELKVSTPLKTRAPTDAELKAYMSGALAGSKTGLEAQINGEESLKANV